MPRACWVVPSPAAGTLLSFLALGLIKLWFWMEMQKVAIVREIKRVELQLASLTAALRSG